MEAITLKERTVLVTGASSGIGDHVARQLAAAGAQVVLGARRKDRVDALAAAIKAEGGSALALELDVTSGDPATEADFGDAFLMKQGFTLVWVGWEFDVPDQPGLIQRGLCIGSDFRFCRTGIFQSF